MEADGALFGLRGKRGIAYEKGLGVRRAHA